MSKFYVVQVSSILAKEFAIEANSYEEAEHRASELDLYSELDTSDWVERETKSDLELDGPEEAMGIEVIRLES